MTASEEWAAKNISNETKEKLARSLSWETAELLPFMPYLLQDFWELGSDPEVMVQLVKKHIAVSQNTRILDVACGKGPVSVRLAQKLGVRVKGIDLMPEFIEYARSQARELAVEDLCEFVLDDINEALKTERDYDCLVFGAVGTEVLGGPAEALRKLKSAVKPGGYILIEEGYIPTDGKRESIRFNRDAYFPLEHWLTLFKETGLELVETASGHSEENLDKTTGVAAITNRANELTREHPDKKELFEAYVKTQQDEYNDIDDSLVCVTWMLKSSG
ncbi:MAG: class I SAM-dependent methyltransferase [Coriobacteriia bacterium]|nr:class I SAM-dependent methyltransferase [Coriobacteriia bacterium]MCL2750795.1 class I SAM-dependent methyltransferase [Coriobacteriia bacterium]